jgi:hypothetical protein
MQVFTNEFVQAVKSALDGLQPLQYLTREQVCLAIGIDKSNMNAISILLVQPEFAAYETVKSRGIRKKKEYPQRIES